LVNSLTLRQWYTKYHPDSGPIRIATADELENIMSAEWRMRYAGLKKDVLSATLGKRRKPVLVSVQVCKTWLEKLSAADAMQKRPASGSSYEPPAAGVLKRPAAVSANAGSAKKRPANAITLAVSGASSSSATASAKPTVSAASSSSAPADLFSIIGADELEKTCGEKYRQEMTDWGFGHAFRDMVKVLRTWGYDTSREACQEWLRKYRLGNDGAKDGGVGVYVLSRQDLQRWYHVEGLGPAALQEKYRTECGVYANRAHLARWVSAQTLPSLENNEDIHAHACGEHVLDQLQKGKKPEEVVEKLLAEYLVKTTKERVQAYRYYREQRGSYWTTEKLQQHHWERLYAHVSLERTLVAQNTGTGATTKTRALQVSAKPSAGS